MLHLSLAVADIVPCTGKKTSIGRHMLKHMLKISAECGEGHMYVITQWQHQK